MIRTESWLAERLGVNLRLMMHQGNGEADSLHSVRGDHAAAMAGKYVWWQPPRSTLHSTTMRRGGRPTGSPLHHSDVSRLVKHYAARIGLDPKEFSAHSLRAGFVTSAAAHHARLDKIMEVTRHRSADMVMQYVRDAESFTDHAGAAFL